MSTRITGFFRWVCVLAAITVPAGCGSRPPHTPGRGSLPPQPAGTLSAQVAACASPHATEAPCTAIHPAGASAFPTRFVEGPLPLALIGGEIQLDNFGAELTAGFENVRKAWYCPEPDPAYGWGVPTRGFGETGGITRSSPCISYATAARNLRYLMDADYLPPVRALRVSFSHSQVDALGDLSWNVGPGTICCELGRLLRTHAWYAAGVFILRYSYANGIFLPGLHARRERERSLLQVVEPPKPNRAKLSAELHVAEHTRHLLHDDIENHRCRKGEHNVPRQPERLRLIYHSLCGRWIKQGGREIALEHRLRRALA